ncbi:hypothetical protein B0T21DRAFT_352132 [Apiosordaria backusii]|uniref:Uncharacterized protein n=1 Tax=Apiosordaria backusii TaxID=314023 RepID=A0AA40AJ07_9PEZI|nr:hypothetical protein B0T21DRAFT_352132 [Apiosordaria backusii]
MASGFVASTRELDSPPSDFFGPSAVREAIPIPWGQYVLCQRGTAKVLAILNGTLKLYAHDTFSESQNPHHMCYWELEEDSKGWLVLRHSETGLTACMEERCLVDSTDLESCPKFREGSMEWSQQFVYRLVHGFGYHLLYKGARGRLAPIVCNSNDFLKLRRDHFTAAAPVEWEFVKVGDQFRKFRAKEAGSTPMKAIEIE